MYCLLTPHQPACSRLFGCAPSPAETLPGEWVLEITNSCLVVVYFIFFVVEMTGKNTSTAIICYVHKGTTDRTIDSLCDARQCNVNIRKLGHLTAIVCKTRGRETVLKLYCNIKITIIPGKLNPSISAG